MSDFFFTEGGCESESRGGETCVADGIFTVIMLEDRDVLRWRSAGRELGRERAGMGENKNSGWIGGDGDKRDLT